MAKLRDKNLYFAQLAEEAQRFDDAVSNMYAIGVMSSSPSDGQEKVQLSVDERNILSASYKKALGERRAAWRTITSIIGKEHARGNSVQMGYAKEYCAKLEAELNATCSGALRLLDDILIPAVTSSEAKVFYLKMRADWCRYMTEFNREDMKAKATEEAKSGYLAAQGLAESDLSVTHPVRLGLALNFSVFQYEVLENYDDARRNARKAFEDAVAEINNVEQDAYVDATITMQLLRDNLALWRKGGDFDLDDG